MDEAERVEIAGHVGRLGTELIRFAELARARLNAMQDRGVPNLSLEDQPHPAIYLEAGLGPWGKDKGDTLHRWRSSPVQRPRELPEPPESPGPGGYFLEAPRRHCRASVQSQEIPEPPESPGELGHGPPRAQRAQRPYELPEPPCVVEEPPEPPDSPQDAGFGADGRRGTPDSGRKGRGPKLFLPMPMPCQLEEQHPPPESPGTPEPPWTPEETESPTATAVEAAVGNRSRSAAFALEPPLAPQAAEPPLAPRAAEPPLALQVVEPPLAPQAAEPPLAPRAAEPPMALQVVEPPLAPEAAEPPLAPRAAEPPLAPQVVEPPLAPQDGAELERRSIFSWRRTEDGAEQDRRSVFSWGRPEDEDWDGRSVFSWGCPEGRAAQAKGSVFSWSEASSRSASRVGPLEPLAPPETQRAIGRPARPRPACDEGRRPTRPSRKAPRTKKLRATSAALSLSALGRLHAEVQELRRQMALLDPVRGAHVALAPAAVQETREPVGELRRPVWTGGRGRCVREKRLRLPPSGEQHWSPMAEDSPLVADVERGRSGFLEDNGLHKGLVRKHVQRLFGAHNNPKFAEHAENAFRAACALVFFAIPLTMPEGIWDFRDHVIDLGFYNSGVCLFIIFNLGTTFGQAFNSCQSGLKGSLAQAFIGWTMYTIWPKGVTQDWEESQMAFYGGLAVGIVYVTSLLIFRFSLPLQMFGISGFAGTWMTFLDPMKPANITPPWNAGYAIKHDTLTQSFACTGVGMLAVMFASCLPYPRWSLAFVTENQLHTNAEMIRVMRTVVDYYARKQTNKYIKDKVIRRLARLKGLTHENKPLLAAAWWECFSSGGSQVKRQVLSSMHDATEGLVDIIWNTWQETMAEDYSDIDKELMIKMRGRLDEVMKAMEVTLNLLVKAASDGSLTEGELRALEKSFEEQEQKDKQMADAFRTARKELTQGKAEVIYKKIRISQLLVYSFSEALGKTKCLAQMVHQFMKEKQEQKKPTRTAPLDLVKKIEMPPPPELDGAKDLCRNLTEKSHVVYASRALIAFFFSFTIGWFGFRDVFQPRTAAIAGTTPFLITLYVGSALVSDLNRIQGLMLGYVMAQILASLAATCSALDLTIHLTITWIWVLVGVFVRESSSTFSSIGSMAAAFGASTLLAHNCRDSHINKSSIFESLACNCIAVLITTIVNLIVPSEPACDQAVKHLQDCWSVIRVSLDELCNPQVKIVTFRSSEAGALLQKAKTMGGEAAFEPRLWYTPWQSTLFDGVAEDTQHMVATLAVLEHACGSNGGPKKEALRQLQERSAVFRSSSGNTVLRKLDVDKKLIDIFKHHTIQRPTILGDSSVYQTFEEEDQRAEREFMEKDLAKVFASEKDRETASVADDEMASIATALANMARMKDQLRSVQHRILQNSHDE
ncbi:unnamed protein product [Durusdinium trenchii]|uniref:Uncharacterized protein n=1 Tax=Durusdinium trenchii TaxID=1381693 RepID=A0ABP0J6B7_9DINO